MKRPAALHSRPSLSLTLLGGLVATLLLTSLLFVAPVFGFPFFDIPRLIGGLFTDDPDTAFWLGFWIFFLQAWLLFPAFFSVLWLVLPGAEIGLPAALLKGATAGLVLAAIGGVLLPVMGMLNQLRDVGLENPGLFGLGFGLTGAVAFIGGHLVYGVALTTIAAMGHGISILETAGIIGYRTLEHEHEQE